jgi:ribosome-associated protein
MIVDEEMVLRNGEVETRKRAKLVAGEKIEVQGVVVNLI